MKDVREWDNRIVTMHVRCGNEFSFAQHILRSLSYTSIFVAKFHGGIIASSLIRMDCTNQKKGGKVKAGSTVSHASNEAITT